MLVNTRCLWNQLKICFGRDISVPDLLPQAALCEFFNDLENIYFMMLNHVLSIFKLHIYKSRKEGIVKLERLINNAIKSKIIKKNIATTKSKLDRYNKS